MDNNTETDNIQTQFNDFESQYNLLPKTSGTIIPNQPISSKKQLLILLINYL